MWPDGTTQYEEPVEQESGDQLAICPLRRALLYVAVFYVAMLGLTGCAAYWTTSSRNDGRSMGARTGLAAAPAAVSVDDQLRVLDERLRKLESLVDHQRSPGRVASR